jgi:hypothetical protein
MVHSTASQSSRGDARPAREDWPRVGAKIEGNTVVVRELAQGENPCESVRRAVVVAEPCERYPNLADAIVQAARAVKRALEANGCKAPVVIQV